MPAKGYRKGQSDNREPQAHLICTRLTHREHAAFKSAAASRPITPSKLLRILVTAHTAGRRPELPRAKGLEHERTRALGRIGNNLNQLARQANTGMVPVSKAAIDAALAAVMDELRRS